jgi:1-acyl-sn-glycerol-3-phosphate acyltransferase
MSAPRPGFLAQLAATVICGFARTVTGARALWRGCLPEHGRRVYFANHSSHGDFVVVWSALPPALRHRTRPVAAADYWSQGRLRRFLVDQVFRAVLVSRGHVSAHGDDHPVAQMSKALAAGDALIVFPEGTRHSGDELLPFKSGIYHLAKAHPEVEFVPVWIENLGRVIPKGALIPVPLLCSLSFGPPLRIAEDERKPEFLARARAALAELAPPTDCPETPS